MKKIALITDASRGIGAETARRLAKDGYDVCINYHSNHKAAIDTLTRGLAVEVADQGIRVNCVRPGFIDTDMHADGGETNRVERVAPLLPMKRAGQPEEIANAIAWLLSDEASYVTGSFTEASGGR